MTQKVYHPQPPRKKKNAGLGRDLEPRRFYTPAERPRSKRLFGPVGIQAGPVKEEDKQRTQKRIQLVGDANDGAAARLQDAEHLPQRDFIVGEVLNRAHGIDEIESIVTKGERSDIGSKKARALLSKNLDGLLNDAKRDVEAHGADTLLRGPT